MPSERAGSRRRLVCRKSGQPVPSASPVCPFPDEACKYRTDCVIYAATQEARDEDGREQLRARRDELERQIAHLTVNQPGHDTSGRHEMKLFALREQLDEVCAELVRLDRH